MGTPISSFDLDMLDMAFVISQTNLNTGLGEYIEGLGLQVVFAYDIEGGKAVPPKDPDNPMMSFNGWVANRPAVTTIDMSQPWDNNNDPDVVNNIMFNFYFTDATFTTAFGNYATWQGVLITDWCFSFVCPLQIQPLPGPPPPAAASLQATYGDIFALQQIMFDVSNTILTEDQELNPLYGWDGTSWAYVLIGLQTYMSDNAASLFGPTPPALTYLAYQNAPTGPVPVPTFTPTSAAFTLISSGDPDSSGLAVCMMVNGDAMPTSAQLANEFAGTSLIDPSYAGVAIVHSTLAWPQLVTAMTASALADTAAQYIVPSADNDSFVYAPGSLDGQSMTAAGTPGQTLANYAMPSQAPGANYVDDAGDYSDTYYVTVVTDSSVAVVGSSGQLQVNGTISVTANGSEYSGDGSGNIWNTETFNYDWYAQFALQPINDSGAGGGAIGVTYVQPDNPNPPCFPTTYSSLTGSTVGFPPATTWDTYFAATIANIAQNIEASLPGQIAAAPLFVFPGGGDFSFTSAGISTAGALYSTIAYQNPG